MAALGSETATEALPTVTRLISTSVTAFKAFVTLATQWPQDMPSMVIFRVDGAVVAVFIGEFHGRTVGEVTHDEAAYPPWV